MLTPAEVLEKKLTLTRMPYIVMLACEVEQNELGEFMTVHVKDAGFRIPEDLPTKIADRMRELTSDLFTLALKQALANHSKAGQAK